MGWRRLGATIAALALGGAAATASVAPGARELAQALSAGGHRARPLAVRCAGGAPEEPTEFNCRYRLPGGLRCETEIATDGSAWRLIDTPDCRRARR